ncbi:hypothetical protein [Candidatus Proelusimicrobium excrementi]|uniref:hypothetical protein n=1 Tax=Candidatus Proelusimicrobium excrementi TaxID=3416222 RepID=UPI003D0ACFF1
MYRVWYSTESFADFIIDHTILANRTDVIKNKMYESDANRPRDFHSTPDHIRKILYLDACDLIVEKDNEPIFSVEVTTEAGTGHNAFQRFARIAASVENGVPAFYIYPEGVIIKRKNVSPRWDKINPLIFRALESVMNIYQIPALLYYFPSDIAAFADNPQDSPHLTHKGLRYDQNITYAGCPDSQDAEMREMFQAINEILNLTENCGVANARNRLLSNLTIRNRRNFMQEQFTEKANGRSAAEMSPLTAVHRLPTQYLLNYLSQYEDNQYHVGELLRAREYTSIYQINASFRGDPYPGALSAIDYLCCREGKTFEDRRDNLVLVFGKVDTDEQNHTIQIINENGSTITDFFVDVQSSARHNLLVKNYHELKNYDIPRYLMQVRYGSTYSKVKHIRVFSYFADAILFPDGSLWRDA